MTIRYVLLLLVFSVFLIRNSQGYNCYNGSSVCCERLDVTGDILGKSERWTISYADGQSDTRIADGSGVICETDFIPPHECWPYFKSRLLEI